MEKATSLNELKALLVGSNGSQKYLVGNIIVGTQVFDQDVTSTCDRGEGQVCGRKVTLVKTPGWLQAYDIVNTPELFKTEAILSATPGLHAFLLVINADRPFKNIYKKGTENHLQHFFGDKVWDHTIVVFNHRDSRNVEDYIKREGAPLQSLLAKCGNRYHVLCDDGTDNKDRISELFEKIDTMVAKNSCYKVESERIQEAKSKRMEVERKAEERHLQMQQQRQKLRSLMAEPKPNLRILMVGWVFSGKSAAGNSILKKKAFTSGNRTVEALKQSGVVAGREVVIVDTPGWWKFFPATFISEPLTTEILTAVSLCSPSPNVILLTVPFDTSFTEEQRRVTEDHMRRFGHRVWRHIIVVFTFGDALGDKSIEQHIESEGEPLRWLIEKCGNRYHVLNNVSTADDQVIELLEKMEEMVAGNSTFYHSTCSDTDELQSQEYENDQSTDPKAEVIIELLTQEWDRKTWVKITRNSMDTPPYMSSEDLNYEGPETEKEGSVFLSKRISLLLEKEWSRREVAMEQASRKYSHESSDSASEPSYYELYESRKKVKEWLKTQQPSSGYGTASNFSDKSEEK